MKVFYAGDLVSSPGRLAFLRMAAGLRESEPDIFALANAENAAGGNGLTPSLAQELLSRGADGLSLGDHAWDKKELYPFLEEEYRLVRPANYPKICPGRGWTFLERGEQRICLISLVGRVFMPPSDCPFRTVDEILEKPQVKQATVKIVDFHAEATSEKICMGRYLAGRVSAVLGSHTHVQTADERILGGATGYISDLGMTGPADSVLGRQYEPVLCRIMTGMPAKFDVQKKGAFQCEGVLLEIDATTGACRSIERVQRIMEGKGGQGVQDD